MENEEIKTEVVSTYTPEEMEAFRVKEKKVVRIENLFKIGNLIINGIAYCALGLYYEWKLPILIMIMVSGGTSEIDVKKWLRMIIK